jgi:hypothetical protein
MTFDPVAFVVSAVNLHLECPPSLLKALADSHPDREVWLSSFFEKSMASSVLTCTAKSPWANIVLFTRKELPRPF